MQELADGLEGLRVRSVVVMLQCSRHLRLFIWKHQEGAPLGAFASPRALVSLGQLAVALASSQVELKRNE